MFDFLLHDLILSYRCSQTSSLSAKLIRLRLDPSLKTCRSERRFRCSGLPLQLLPEALKPIIYAFLCYLPCTFISFLFSLNISSMNVTCCVHLKPQLLMSHVIYPLHASDLNIEQA